MASSRYEELAARVAELRSHLLPGTFSDTGEYADADRISTRALSFRVMAHAEIEAYFEERVVQIAKQAFDSWNKERRLCRALLSLLAFSGREMRRPPDSLAAPNRNKEKAWPGRLDPSERVSDCVTTFVREVTQENHGVRERNLLAMLLPVGFEHTDLDPILLADFDSFGRQRGEAAHTSSGVQVRQGVDPKEEFLAVSRLLTGLQDLDSGLDQLLAAASRIAE